MRQRLRVLIIDDHEVVRAGLRALLAEEPDIEVVGTASSALEALAALPVARPDVVLLDYRLPDSDGASACAEIRRRFPRIAVVVLTSFIGDEVLLACLAAGARGYLTKTGAVARVPEVVRRVARGEAVLDPEAVERVLEWARDARIRRPVGSLAPVELEVLRNLSRGRTIQQIARSLHVSEDAVKVRVRSIKRVLGASDRAHAVALAVKRGLI